MKKFILSLIAIAGLSVSCYATYDGSYGGQQFDEDLGGLITIDTVHEQVHQGNVYTVSASTAVLADGATASFLINLTSATITDELHISFGASLGGQGYVGLYENATFASSGTAVTAYNMNRDSTNTYQAGIIFTPNPTGITSLGTTLIRTLTPGGVSTPTRIGGMSRGQTEWILKPGRTYLIVITNSSGGNIAVSLSLEFYEAD